MDSLAVKYRPKTFDDVTEQSIITEILESICEHDDTMSCRNFLLTGPAGCGKAQPLTSHVLTPHGYIEMGDIKVGDDVFTENGDIATVTGVFPQGIRPVYRIYFTGGDRIDVSDEHLNILYYFDKEQEEFVKTVIETKELVEDTHPLHLHHYYISNPTVDFVYRDIGIDPYLLGILFASSNIDDSFTISLSGTKTKIYTKDYWLSTPISRHLFQNGIDFVSRIKEDEDESITCLMCDSFIESLMEFYQITDVVELTECFKTIPDIIKYNDMETRHQFVEGALAVFDVTRNLTKGELYFDNGILYDEDFRFLVESMGYSYHQNGTYHTIYLSKLYEGKSDWDDCFEASYYINLAPEYTRRILKIEELEPQECQCIYVNDDSHSYISDCMIPTHNTTCARIMSNMLNDNVGEPIEIDAASHGNIESVRDLVQQAQQYPIGQKYKIFIVDECHSISNASWQVLLKILEESPAMTIWIFCTTNPEKIPQTIISRVQTFQLSKISLDGINDRLIHVLESEIKEGRNITYEKVAVNYIAKMANGGMRDALTLLDKALAYSTDLTSANISNALNLPEYDDYFNLLSAYAKHDNQRIAEIVDSVYNSGVNFIKWFESFHSFVVNILKFIFLQDINMTMIPVTYQDRISKYSENHTVICLSLANKLIKMNQDLRTSQYLQEIALTYLCTIPKSN